MVRMATTSSLVTAATTPSSAARATTISAPAQAMTTSSAATATTRYLPARAATTCRATPATTSSSSMEPSTAVYEYDPGSDRWRMLAPMPTSRGALGAAVLAGKIHAVSGVGAGGKDTPA